MAGLGELLQRIARDLEQAGGQQPADDLRARLGYGPSDDGDDDDPGIVDDVDAPESESIWRSRPARAREAGAAQEPEAVRAPGAARGRATVPRPEASRAPSRTRPPVPETHRAPPPSPAAPYHFPATPDALLSVRIRARLRTPDALREAFVVKELLDKPLGRRRTR